MTGEFRYLQQRGRTWYARVRVPPSLIKVLGKTSLIRSLKTHSIAEARQRRWVAVAEMKEYLAARKKGSTKTAIEHALEWRQLHLRAGTRIDPDLGMSERDQVALLITDVAEELEPVHGVQEARQFIRVATSESPIIGRMIEPWLQEKAGSITAQTAGQHRTAVQAFLEWTGKQGMDEKALMTGDVDRKLAGRFVTEFLMTSGKAAKTSNRYISSLSTMWQWLIKKGLVTEENPWERQGLPKGSKRGTKPKRRAFSPDELLQILDGDAPQPLREITPLALYSGARQDELCSAMAADVQEDAGGRLTIIVREGKSSAAVRRVPVHPLVAGIVQRRRDTSPDGYLFHECKPGGPDKKRNWYLTRQFTAYRRKLGIDGEDTVFHSLRKNTAGALEAAGVPESTAALIIGHDRPHMTYGLYNDGGVPLAVLREAVERISFGKEVDEAARRLTRGV